MAVKGSRIHPSLNLFHFYTVTHFFLGIGQVSLSFLMADPERRLLVTNPGFLVKVLLLGNQCRLEADEEEVYLTLSPGQHKDFLQRMRPGQNKDNF